jgi:hypothetical protein
VFAGRSLVIALVRSETISIQLGGLWSIDATIPQEGTRQLDQFRVVDIMFVVADQQLVALRQLSQGSFHYPATWFVTTWPALLPTILPNGPDLGHMAVALCHLVRDRIVEGTVQSQFSSGTVTSGRLMTKASIVASSSFISRTRILAIITRNKLPSRTINGDCVVPFLPRSVGGLPVFSPSNQASSGRPSDACHRQFTNPEFVALIDQGPADLLKDAVAALLMGGKQW